MRLGALRFALPAIIVSATIACDLLGAARCSDPGGLVWSGGTRARPPVPTFSRGCCLPSARETVAALAGVHILVAGDSTYRYPVQFFQRSWLGCEAGRRASAADLTAEERRLCEPRFDNRVWMRRPMGGFWLNNEFVPLVEDFRRTTWWKRWVMGQGYLSRGSVTQRPPDAVIMGSWLWHVKLRGGSLRIYEAQLRALLGEFVAQPSYRNYWAHGRLFWREALPTEHAPPYDSAKCAAANAVAQRVLREVAPGVRWLSLAPALARSPPSPPGHLAMTLDGKHYHWPVQVALLQTALGVLIREGAVIAANHTDRA